MNDGILDLRFAICDLAAGGRKARSRHNGRQLASFLVQGFDASSRQQSGLDNQFHPKGGLVGLLLDGAQLGDELSFRAATAGGPVVGANRGAAANQLPTNGPAFDAFGQCTDELKHTQRELFGPQFQFFFRHNSSLVLEQRRQPFTSNRKSQI
jgi:hypothetical protein